MWCAAILVSPLLLPCFMSERESVSVFFLSKMNYEISWMIFRSIWLLEKSKIKTFC